MAELDRIRWRCRRGLLELDIMLGPVPGAGLAALSPPSRTPSRPCWSLSDNDLWDLVSGRSDPGDARQAQPATRVLARAHSSLTD